MKNKNLEWSPTLLDNGALKTRKEWIAWCSNKKLNPEGWRLPTSEEFNDLFKNQKEYKNVVEGIKQDLKNQWLMTSNIFVDIKGQEWPVGRDHCDDYYGIVGNFNSASRGVREKKSKETEGT